MVEARGEMTETEKHGSSHFASLGKASGLALGAVATVGAGIAVASVKMASTFEDSRARLERAVSNSGSSFAKVGGQVSAYEGRLEKLGFTHTQTDDALATLTTALGSPAKAMAALGLAADLARYKHIGLSEASIVVAKAEEGQLRPLKQLGIDLPIMASTAQKVKVAQENLGKAQAAVNAILAKSPDAVNPASKAHAAYERALGKVSDAQKKVSDLSTAGVKIMDALGKKIGGQAATAAGTFGGKLEVAKAKVEDLGISLGLKLIPVIEKVVGWLTKAVGWMEKHKTAMQILGGVVATVAAIMVASWVAVTVAAAAAFVAENLATLGIIAGLMLLVAGIVYLATHWKKVWSDIKQWTADAVNWIKDHLYLIAGIILGPFGLAIVWLGKHWQGMWRDVKAWTLDGVNAVVGFFVHMGVDIKHWTLDAVNAVVGFFLRLYRDVTGWTRRMWTDVASFFANIWRDSTMWARRMWTDIGGYFAHLYGTVTTWLRRLAGDAANWGANIIHGLVNGITRALNFGKVVGDWLHSALNSALHFLGIHLSVVSDSSTMFQVGKKIVSSIAKGITSAPGAVIHALEHVLGGVLGAAGKAVSGVFVGKGNSAGGPVAKAGAFASEQALGQQMAAARGWTGAEWASFNALVMGESGWNPNAQNPTSSAFGIAQNIGGPAGYPDASAGGQIDWMLNYIAQRYGDPVNAYNTWLSRSPRWYDQGGWLPTGLSLAMNATGRPERILAPGEHGGGATFVLNFNGPVIGEGGMRAVARQLRVAIERDARAGTPSFA